MCPPSDVARDRSVDVGNAPFHLEKKPDAHDERGWHVERWEGNPERDHGQNPGSKEENEKRPLQSRDRSTRSDGWRGAIDRDENRGNTRQNAGDNEQICKPDVPEPIFNRTAKDHQGKHVPKQMTQIAMKKDRGQQSFPSREIGGRHLNGCCA